MVNALKSLFVALVSQIPVLAAFWAWWNSNPVLVAIGVLIYEISLLTIAFGREVWEEELKPQARIDTAKWIRNLIKGFSLGFHQRYKEEVINRHRFFNTKGLRTKAGTTPELHQVFIELEVDTSNPHSVPTNPIVLPATDNDKQPSLKSSEHKRLIWDYIAQLKGQSLKVWAVIGAPGCGKSTLVQHIALTLAENQQHQYRVPALIPLLLFLRDHIKPIVEGKVTLETLAQNHFSNNTHYPELQPPPNWFRKELKKGRMMVLLDGLDEVSNVNEREKVAAWVDAQIENYPKCYFILTARPQGYRDAPLQRANVLKVQPLNPTQVSRFIQNWHLATKIVTTGKNDRGVRQDAKRDAQDLLQRLWERSTLNDLTVNPLLLTMITVVHDYNASAVLPMKRVKLYEEISNVFLEYWQAEKQNRNEWLEEQELIKPNIMKSQYLSAAQKRKVLEPLAAYMMQNRKRGDNDNRLTLNEKKVLEIIKPYLVAEGIDDTGVQHLAFLKDLNDNCGIFTEVEVKEWGFMHRTFQEYLCATYWCNHPEKVPTNWDQLVENVWWQETILFYAAQTEATAIATAALTRNTLGSLIFVANLDEEASVLTSNVRTEIKSRIEGYLASKDVDLRRLAAEIVLHRRIKSNFRPIDEHRAMDKDFITCAEYQLFIDEGRREGFFHEPYHWVFSDFFQSGLSPVAPIAGIRITSALLFCEWLSKRTGKQYRLPTIKEVIQTSNDDSVLELTLDLRVKENPVLSKNKREALEALEVKEVDLPMNVDVLSLTSFAEVTLNRVLSGRQSRDRDRERASAIARATARTRVGVLDQALELDRARDRDHDRAIAIDLDPVRKFARAIAIDLSRIKGFARELEHDLTRSLDRDFDHTLDDDKFTLPIARANALALAHDLVHGLDPVFAKELKDFRDSASTLNQNHGGDTYYSQFLIKMQQFEAKFEAKPDPNISEFEERRRRLILCLFKIAKAQDNQGYCLAYWHYQRTLFQYAYQGALLRQHEALPRGSQWRFWKKDPDIEKAKEAYRVFYWFYTLLLARQANEENLSAWEGVRLVREYTPPKSE